MDNKIRQMIMVIAILFIIGVATAITNETKIRISQINQTNGEKFSNSVFQSIQINSNDNITFGNETNAPMLYSGNKYGDPWELFLQPQGGNSTGELGIMPSGTSTVSGISIWNSGNYSNGGYAQLYVLNADLIFAYGIHGVDHPMSGNLYSWFNITPYYDGQRLGSVISPWDKVYANNFYGSGSGLTDLNAAAVAGAANLTGLTISTLAGTGNAYACIYANGTLYRSATACV